MAGEIHILHQNFRRAGGMERYAILLAATFKSLGHSVIVHARNCDPALAQETGAALEPIKSCRFPRKLCDYFYFRKVDRLAPPAHGVQLALSRVRARDLCICGGTHLGYLRRGRKLVGPFDKLQVWMEREAYRSARVVVSHSDRCTEELLSLYGLPENKVVTLYPPVDDKFSPAPDARETLACRDRLGLPRDKCIFLFPSMGHRNKGLFSICKALENCASELVLAVAGKPPARNRWGFVRYLGYVNDMALAYRAADFTILGSTYEAFGLVGPESILCGTRLIFEKNIGCLPVIKPEYVLTFSVKEPSEIRAAVASAINMARNGQHRIETPSEALLYNPGAAEHARSLLQVAAASLLSPGKLAVCG